jgi:hypothetical protein
MRDIAVQGEAFLLPLRFAMVATRAAAELRGVQEGKPLNERGVKSLLALSELLDIAAKGGTILRDKSMAGYSAEAMSAYRLIQSAKLPDPNFPVEADSSDPAQRVSSLQGMAEGLRTYARGESKTLPVEDYRNFLIILAQRSLDESHRSKEEVLPFCY